MPAVLSSSSPLTVLHYIGDGRDRAGAGAVVRALAAENRFTCVLGGPAGKIEQREPALPTIVLPVMAEAWGGLKTLWRARAVAREAERWLALWPERIFHAHTREGLAAALWLRRWGQKRTVVSVREYGGRRWFYRWAAAQLGERLFWDSPAMKRHYGVKTAGDPWAQCIPGCAATAVVSRPASLDSKVIRIGGIGPLVSRQCWHLVLDALAKMPATQRWKVRFEHAGEILDTEKSKRYAHALRTQTGALSLGNLVTWHGSEATTEQVLAEIDVLVMPSFHGLVAVPVLEALAVGVPVLAANSGGARDVIVSARNGWLFRAGDPGDLARALVMLVETDARRTVEPRPGKDWRFSAGVVAAQWEQVYRRMIGGG